MPFQNRRNNYLNPHPKNCFVRTLLTRQSNEERVSVEMHVRTICRRSLTPNKTRSTMSCAEFWTMLLRREISGVPPLNARGFSLDLTS